MKFLTKWFRKKKPTEQEEIQLEEIIYVTR